MSSYDTTANFHYFLSQRFNSFQDFQGPQPKFKDFPGPGIFFCQFQDFPGFSRTVATLKRACANTTTVLMNAPIWVLEACALTTKSICKYRFPSFKFTQGSHYEKILLNQ